MTFEVDESVRPVIQKFLSLRQPRPDDLIAKLPFVEDLLIRVLSGWPWKEIERWTETQGHKIDASHIRKFYNRNLKIYSSIRKEHQIRRSGEFSLAEIDYQIEQNRRQIKDIIKRQNKISWDSNEWRTLFDQKEELRKIGDKLKLQRRTFFKENQTEYLERLKKEGWAYRVNTAKNYQGSDDIELLFDKYTYLEEEKIILGLMSPERQTEFKKKYSGITLVELMPELEKEWKHSFFTEAEQEIIYESLNQSLLNGELREIEKRYNLMRMV